MTGTSGTLPTSWPINPQFVQLESQTLQALTEPMCNLYSITNQAAISALFRVLNRYVGNLPPMLGMFPDYPAPVIRNSDADRKMVLMRWGMPPPPRPEVRRSTNIRNTSSPHWRGWLTIVKPVPSFDL